jgi:hypothetical protein
MPVDSNGASWNRDFVTTTGNVVVDLLHNFHLECGARLHKLRVYETLTDPTGREVCGYLLVRGSVHAHAYALAIKQITGADITKVLPTPNIPLAKIPECQKYLDEGSHRRLYTWSPADYKEIAGLWGNGEEALPGDPPGELEVVDGLPQGGKIHQLTGVASAFTPDYAPEEIVRGCDEALQSIPLSADDSRSRTLRAAECWAAGRQRRSAAPLLAESSSGPSARGMGLSGMSDTSDTHCRPNCRLARVRLGCGTWERDWATLLAMGSPGCRPCARARPGVRNAGRNDQPAGRCVAGRQQDTRRRQSLGVGTPLPPPAAAGEAGHGASHAGIRCGMRGDGRALGAKLLTEDRTSVDGSSIPELMIEHPGARCTLSGRSDVLLALTSQVGRGWPPPAP